MFARKAAVAIAVALGMLVTRDSHATPPWTERLLTLPGPVAGTIDLGGAFAHTFEAEAPPCNGGCDFHGLGSSVDGVIGIASRVDIGLHVGLRGFVDNLGYNEGVITSADSYARMFDQVAFYGAADDGIYGNAAITNPELRVRVRILHLRQMFELGVEGRSILPFADGTVWTQVVGVPMALHFGRHVRFDFGAYSHFSFFGQPRGTLATFEAPAAFWFQIKRVYLGPMFSPRWYSQNVYPTGPGNVDVSVGFGLGVSLTHYMDFKTQFYFPRINDDARYWGVGAGVGFYFDTSNPYYR